MDEALKHTYEKYLALTSEALTKAQAAPENLNLDNARDDFIDTVTRYISDAGYFAEKGDYTRAMAAITYAHGWLDAGARLGLWEVSDSRLFTVDEKKE